MLISVLKCIHLLLTLSLVGSTFFCLMLISFFSEQREWITRLNRTMLWLLVFSALTGTLLIYPKHYTFHTPWIQAAYFFVFLFGLLASLFLFFGKKNPVRKIYCIGYFLLIGLLIGLIHDAVTKTIGWII